MRTNIRSEAPKGNSNLGQAFECDPSVDVVVKVGGCEEVGKAGA